MSWEYGRSRTIAAKYNKERGNTKDLRTIAVKYNNERGNTKDLRTIAVKYNNERLNWIRVLWER
jgi:hypothetical protein